MQGLAARAYPALARPRWRWWAWAWRSLTSMRTALLLLLLLAVVAVPGSLLPQEPVDPAAVASFVARHPVAGPLLGRLGGFDVYASAWFSAVYLLLVVSLVGCVVPRLRRYWRSVRAAPPSTPRRLSRLPGYRRVLVRLPSACAATGSTAGARQGAAAARRGNMSEAPRGAPGPGGDADDPCGALLARARDTLRRAGYRVRMVDGDVSVAAEKGYLAEAGNLVFHLSLLGVLSAVVVGAFYGYSGQVVIAEGQTFANTPTGYDSLRMGRLVPPGALPPFAVTLDRMNVRFAESGPARGAPRQFLATVTVQAPRAAGSRVRLSVNHPLRVAGAKVYLVGNGYAPSVTVWDARGTVVFAGPVPFIPRDGKYTSVGAIKVPDASPSQLGFVGVLLPTAEFDLTRGPVSTFPDLRRPRLVLTAYAGDLGLDSGIPQSVYALETSRMTQLRAADGGPLRLLLAPGGTQDLPGGGRIRLDGVGRYVALDVRRDPGKLVALVSSSTGLVGLVAALVRRRRRLWVRVAAVSDAAIIEIAGLSPGHDPGLDPEVAGVLDRIRSVLL